MANQPITLADVSALVNKRYSNKQPQDLTKRRHTFLSRVKKLHDFSDEDFEFAVIGGNSQGINATFSLAQGNKNQGGSQQRFAVKRAHGYGVMSLATEALLATKGMKTSFVNLKIRQFDGIMAGLMDDLAVKLYLDGSGVKGTYDSAPSAKVFKFQTAEHAKRFNEGERVQLWDVSAGAYINGGAVGVIDSIDEDAGTVTLTTNVAVTFNGIAAGDYLVREGEYSADPKTDLLAPIGLAGWIPDTAPGAADNFWGANRSKHVTRYSGHRLSVAAGTPIAKILTQMGSKIGGSGGIANLALVSDSTFEQLTTELGVKKYYQDQKEAGAGFKGVTIHVHDFDVEVMPDTFCPSDHVYMLDMDNWYWKDIDGTPILLDQDGKSGQREGSADGVEWRWGYYGNLYCEAPRNNAVAVIQP